MNIKSVESFGEAVADIKKIFSINGHSRLLQTTSLPAKLFSLALILLLSTLTVYFLFENLHKYTQWTVITDVRTENVDSLTLPAVTICMEPDDNPKNAISQEFNNEMLPYCRFDSNKQCSVNDFEKFTIQNPGQSFKQQQENFSR